MKKSSIIIVVAFLSVFFVANIIRYAYRAPRRHYSDFRVYYATGERFLAHTDIYSRPDKTITPFKYSPVFAMAVSPLSLLPKYQASLVFWMINFFIFLAIFWLSRELIGVRGLSDGQMIGVYFATFVMSLRFVLHVLDSGQVNLLMLLLVLLSLYALQRRRLALSGAALAFSMLIKYMPAVFLPYFLWRRNYKLVLWTVVFLVAFCLLPAVVVGWENNLHYLMKWLPSIVHTSLDRESWFDEKNQSLIAMVLRLLVSNPITGAAAAGLSFNQGLAAAGTAGAFIYAPLVLWKGKPGENVQLIDYGGLLFCMALFNPNAWTTNFVVYIYVYMLVWYYLIKDGFRDKLTLIAALVAFILSSWVSESVVGNSLQYLLAKMSTVTLATLILMGVLFRLKFRRPAALLVSRPEEI